MVHQPIDIVGYSSEPFFGAHFETWIFQEEK